MFSLDIPSINDSLQLLSKIPLLPCLHNDKEEAKLSPSPPASSEEEFDKSKNSLFDWINSQVFYEIVD